MKVGELKRGLLLRCAKGWTAYATTGNILKMLPAAIAPSAPPHWPGEPSLEGPGHDGIMMFLGTRDKPPTAAYIDNKQPKRWYEVLHASGIWCISGRDFRYIDSLDCEVNRNV
jgi:hypothetical protein